MAKLHFFYGTMGSSKSLDLIRANYNYREKGLQTLVFKPAVDTRGVLRNVSSKLVLAILALMANLFH